MSVATDQGTPLTGPARGGVAVAYGLALAVLVLRLVGDGLPFSVELPGAIAMTAVVAVPPTLALLSTRRPVLLLPAGVVAVTFAFGVSVLFLPLAVVGVVWIVSHIRSGARAGPVRMGLVAVVSWTLTVAAFVMLFLHLDPRCTETLVDGTVREIEAVDESGWVWEVGGTSSGTMRAGPDVVSGVCSSDTVTIAEAVISLGLSIMAVGLAWRLARGPTEVSVD